VTVAFLPVASAEVESRLTDGGFRARALVDAEIPWWAIELVDLLKSDPLFRARQILRHTRPRGATLWNMFAQLLELAEKPLQQPIEKWRELAYNDTDPDGTGGKIATVIREAAMADPRSFVAFCDIRDEEDEPIVLKQFHLEALKLMRQKREPACVLLPYAHGKSWLSSELVPLMDWAEWPRATEGRIYLDEDLAKKWTGRLQQRVEENESMQRLFPWIRKPKRGDTCFGIWSTEGFAIGGNPIKQRSFEPHTIKSSKTGFRFNRTGIDDVVSDKEAGTVSIQDGYESYIKAVALTMRKVTKRQQSKWGTVFPGFYLCGTLYDRNDVNYRLFKEYREKGNPVLRRDVYIDNDPTRVIWPEVVPVSAIQGFKDDMGIRAFNMRLRNQVGGREHAMFPEQEVDCALRDGRTDDERFAWCVVPPQTPLMIGLDPGSGNRPSWHGARYPAWAVYGARDRSRYQAIHPSQALRDTGDPIPLQQQHDIEHHLIQWGRMEGYGFSRQCQTVVDLARFYNCPVAVEDNGVQIVWAQEIAKIAPDIRVICHTTGENKRDPQQGVDQFEPIVHNRRLAIHAEGAPAEMVKAVREEFIAWKGSTEKSGGFSDILMALWIARHQFALHVQVAQPVKVTYRPVPLHVQRFQRRYR
jgi:hypothetical protein